MVKEFYANLSDQVVKKVRVRGKLIAFDSETINRFYNLKPMEDDRYKKFLEKPNYVKLIKLLTNGQGEWKTNSEGYAVNFKAKYLTYVRLISRPSTSLRAKSVTPFHYFKDSSH